MLRLLCLCLMIGLCGPVAAQPRMPFPQVARLVWDTMRLDDLAPLIRDEAVAEGALMGETLFPGGETDRWAEIVAAIHDPARLRVLFVAGMTAALAGTDLRDLQAGLDFYRGDLGQRLLELEIVARRAMLNEAVEDAARAAFARAQQDGTHRAELIARLIDTADLVEPNVASGLNAAIAFAQAFQGAGGLPMPMTQEEILTDAWAREPQLRADAQDWIGAYLFLAYAPLTDAQLETAIAFAGSPGGRAIARLMLAGFDTAFLQVSRDMGVAAAIEIRARPL
ncbi:DUF2059 domain-containing protein [Paracoccus subflavus]|uniref:DUF2059 domain-containing protein n=1 Tax=Paracoccus subflavus TaxID=2528244 RepID=A0A4Q9FZ27_9RHOB|nr:DUF2059 domain-containing protein [Paracoccus subflavus]TBN39525.1 DUF2059 domain-containing protein [Paracoccus subflavus]